MSIEFNPNEPLFDDDSKYRYSGLTLTPNVMAHIFFQLFEGKRVSRKRAISKVVQFHSEHGGITDRSTDYVSKYKKAMIQLKDFGVANVGYGIWEINYSESASDEENDFSDQPINEYGEEDDDNLIYEPDIELGEGDKAVYVYYYDSYKELAHLRGEDKYPCKIGRTDVNPIQRIIGQSGTCYPEFPHVAVIFHCEDSSLLETYLHTALKLKDRWIEDAPGNEWFRTSPEEVLSIYRQAQQ